jgi:hypothetical protein
MITRNELERNMIKRVKDTERHNIKRKESQANMGKKRLEQKEMA